MHQENDSNPNKLGEIENIVISCNWKNNQEALIIHNGDLKEKRISIWYKENGVTRWHQLRSFEISAGDQQVVELPKEYQHWEKLGFKIGTLNGSVPVARLKRLLDAAKRQADIEDARSKYSKPSTEPLTNSINDQQNLQLKDLQSKFDKFEKIVDDLKSEIENLKNTNTQQVNENSKHQTALDKIPRNIEQVFYEAANQVLQITFARLQVNGETLSALNQICYTIIAELNRFNEKLTEQESYTISIANERLTNAINLMQFKLSETPSPEKFLENQPVQLADLALSDHPPDTIRFSQFEVLCQTYWEDLKNFASEVPNIVSEVQSILDQTVTLLVDGFSPEGNYNATNVEVSRSFYENCLPNILQTIGLELVPIEIGRTDADARIHEIRGTSHGAFKTGVIIEILQHGLRKISNHEIIKKPVVIRGEPE